MKQKPACYLGQLSSGRKFSAEFFRQDIDIKVFVQRLQRRAVKMKLNVNKHTHIQRHTYRDTETHIQRHTYKFLSGCEEVEHRNLQLS